MEHLDPQPNDPIAQARQRDLDDLKEWVRAQAAGPRILVLGDLQGPLALALAADGHEVSGAPADLSSAEGHAADAADLPFGPGPFDTVVLADALSGLDDPQAFLELVRSLLDSRGRLLLSEAMGTTAPDNPVVSPTLSRIRDWLAPLFDTESFETQPTRVLYHGLPRQEGAAPISPTNTQPALSALEKTIQDLETLRRQALAANDGRLAEQQERLEHLGEQLERMRGQLSGSHEEIKKFEDLVQSYEKRHLKLEKDLINEKERLAAQKELHRAYFDKAERRVQDFRAQRDANAQRYLSCRNSLSYRFGDILFSAFGKPGMNTIKLPFRLAQLAIMAIRRFRASQPSTAASTGAEDERRSFPAPPKTGRVRVAAILDEFSASCFAAEAELVTFRPDNWEKTLQETGAELLLVESAWHGNDGSWQYRVASYQKNMGDELIDLVARCKENGVPTVFWNKEDPVHFERFIDKAKLFDVILTTDANCIPRYREAVGHDRVYALPFAAQPAIHNPIQTEPRLNKPCFAGTYYKDRHEQRRDDMTFLLRPSMEFGLDIYDRMFGAAAKEREKFLFPEEYQSAIRGRLEYKDMVNAYKRYGVFLNVNSVKHSPTMFSRRVFELLASGTPVISTHSDGVVELLGSNGVFIANSEDDTRRHLQALLSDPEQWARASAMGIRHVLSEHTYRHRFSTLCRHAGVRAPSDTVASLAVTIALEGEEVPDRLLEALKKQTTQNFSVHIFAEGRIERATADEIRNRLDGREVLFRDYSIGWDKLFEQFTAKVSADFVCNLRPGALYGPRYLEESALFLDTLPIRIIGKTCRFEQRDSGEIEIIGEEHENRMTRQAPAGSISMLRSVLNADRLRQMLADDALAEDDERIFAPYRFNYLEPATAAPEADADRWILP